MKPPLISVILPVFNSEETISRSINSILDQTFPNFELIIVNNGSSDQTKNRILEFKDSRICHLELPHPNLVTALNFGVEQAKGAFIARMDADDYSYSNRFEIQIALLQQNPNVGLVSGKVNYVGDAKKNEGYFRYVDWANSILNGKEIYLSRFQESTLPHPSIMFRKSVGQKHGFYEEGDFPEDFELWNRWLDAGVRMSKVDEIVLDWHDSPSRLSRVNSMYKSEKFSAIKAKYFIKWFERKFESRSPDVYIWGTGSSVRKKIKPLEELGLQISKFIDVKRSQSLNSIYYRDLKFDFKTFILSYVSDRKGKLEIRNYMNKLGFTEGENYYMME